MIIRTLEPGRVTSITPACDPDAIAAILRWNNVLKCERILKLCLG
jgi:hypothetical protein